MTSKTNSTGTVKARINYEALTSPEHIDWKHHRQLTTVIPTDDAGYRGCIGLALLINSTNSDSWSIVPAGKGILPKTFVPDKTVAWASIVDVPIGYFRVDSVKRETHWSTVRPTTMKFGMPCLTNQNIAHAYDFRVIPHDTRSKTPGSKADPLNITLNPSANMQLFRVFNKLEWAMTTTAFCFRRDWCGKRKAMCDALGVRSDPEQKVLAFGGGLYDGVADPKQWMPKAYVAFPEKLREIVYDRATRATGSPTMLPVHGAGLREAFVDAMGQKLAYRATFDGQVASVERSLYMGIPVLSFILRGDRGERDVVRFFRETCVVRKAVRTKFKAGDVIAEESFDVDLPTDWYFRTPQARWDRWTWLLVPRRLDAVMRLWFERQAVWLKPGLVHYPAQISSLAALSSAVDADLFWEVGDSLEFFDDASDSLVFPTLRIDTWHDMTGVLPGDVSYDLTPKDVRFESRQDQVARVARYRASQKHDK